MASRYRSSVPDLVDAVGAYFTANNVGAVAVYGSRERTKQNNQGLGGANRVAFAPSDDGGKAGRIVAVKHPGPRRTTDDEDNETARRAIFDWEHVLMVSIWAVDASDPENERAQLEAVETLLEHTINAVQSFAHANAIWGDVTWTPQPVERVFGRELRVGLTYRHPMFETENEIVRPSPVVHRIPEA